MLKITLNNKQNYRLISENRKLLLDGKEIHWDIAKISERHFHIIKDNKSFAAEIISADYSQKTFTIRINENDYTVQAKDKYDELLHQLGMDNAASQKVNEIKAPMPGLVLKVLAENGKAIKKGDSVLVLEAMKMENVIKSPGDGTVKQVKVKAGDKVEKNELLIVME